MVRAAAVARMGTTRAGRYGNFGTSHQLVRGPARHDHPDTQTADRRHALAASACARLPARALTRDTSAEVQIVGCGITGAMIGEALAEDALDTILVDRRRPRHGSRIRLGGLLRRVVNRPADYRRNTWPQELLGRARLRRQGITYSRIPAEIIRSALTGEPDSDADLYAFKR